MFCCSCKAESPGQVHLVGGVCRPVQVHFLLEAGLSTAPPCHAFSGSAQHMQAHAPQAGSLSMPRHGGALPDSSRKSWSGAEGRTCHCWLPSLPWGKRAQQPEGDSQRPGVCTPLALPPAEVKSFVQWIRTEPLPCARCCSRDWLGESLGAHGPHVLVNGEPQSATC